MRARSALRGAVAMGVAAAAAASLAYGDTGGVIKGRVLLKGAPPPPSKAKVGADPHCQAQHPNGLEQPVVAVSNGGVSGVLVHLKTGVKGSFPAPAAAAVLDQKGCTYSPAMVAVQAGQPLKIRNSDPTLHNVHFRPKRNPEINIGQPRAGMESTRTFAKPEVLVPIGCDVHPWMRAHLAVLPHPFFAVTDAEGRYEIRGVPAGRYEVEALHPRLGPASAGVDHDGGAVPLDLTLSVP